MAQFLEKINNMFDSVNSENLYDSNPNKRPMSERNPQVFQKMVLNYLKKLGNKIKKKKKYSVNHLVLLELNEQLLSVSTNQKNKFNESKFTG